MTSVPPVDIATLHLDRGAHSDCEGACLMEARALLLGRPKSDERPPGTSPVLHSFGISLNDAFPDDRRQELKRFLPVDGVDPLDGTADDGLDEARGYLALDWLIRTYTPAFLDLRPELADVAAELRGLRRIVDLAAAQSAGPVVQSARDKADAAGAAAWAAAWAAAGAAAWAAAWAAAGDAAGDAAGAAARDAAWAAARDAARDAAWAAARDAAGDAAGDAAWDAAGDAAWAAARDAAWAAARDAARDAAWAAARDALQPTVDQLQTSAIELYAAMIKPTAVTE